MEAVLARTVFVVCEGKSAAVVGAAVRRSFGVKSITSAVAGVGGCYIEFVSIEDAEECVNAGVEVDGVLCCAEGAQSRSVIINLFDLPGFVSDDAVVAKLSSLGCEIKGEVVWRKVDDLYLGERCVRVVLPKGVSSLPYGLKIMDALGREMFYRVRHEAQNRVCNGCLSEGHIYKTCPRNGCRRCRRNGHLARDCPDSKIAEVGNAYPRNEDITMSVDATEEGTTALGRDPAPRGPAEEQVLTNVTEESSKEDMQVDSEDRLQAVDDDGTPVGENRGLKHSLPEDPPPPLKKTSFSRKLGPNLSVARSFLPHASQTPNN